MKFYKISTYTLLVLLLLLLFFMYNNYSGIVLTQKGYTLNEIQELKTQKEKATNELELVKQSFGVNEKLNKFWQARRGVHPDTTGKHLSVQETQNKMIAFKKWNDAFGYSFIKPFAFAFGKNRIKKMWEAIDANNQIAGVRVYLTFTNTEVSGQVYPHLDLVFVPVKGDGSDFYKVNVKSLSRPSRMSSSEYTSNNDMILNTSSPCPDNCDQ